jgi:hypothetical protein
MTTSLEKKKYIYLGFSPEKAKQLSLSHLSSKLLEMFVIKNNLNSEKSQGKLKKNAPPQPENDENLKLYLTLYNYPINEIIEFLTSMH